MLAVRECFPAHKQLNYAELLDVCRNVFHNVFSSVLFVCGYTFNIVSFRKTPKVEVKRGLVQARLIVVTVLFSERVVWKQSTSLRMICLAPYC